MQSPHGKARLSVSALTSDVALRYDVQMTNDTVHSTILLVYRFRSENGEMKFKHDGSCFLFPA